MEETLARNADLRNNISILGSLLQGTMLVNNQPTPILSEEDQGIIRDLIISLVKQLK